MGGARPLLITLIIIVSVGIVPQAVGASEDEWADSCEEAEIIEPTGQISGSIDSPLDSDYIKFRLRKGEIINASVLVPSEETDFAIGQVLGTGQFSFDKIPSGGAITPGTPFQWEIFGEESGTSCLRLLDLKGRDADIPYRWELSLSNHDPEPSEFEVTELRDRVRQLESQLQQKNQRISELEGKSSSGNGGDVIIQVTVTPANGQQNFVEGGEAVVQAESENSDVSEMSVEYGSGMYQLDSSGQVAIPLAQTGTQEMTLVYGETTKQVSIEVQAQEGQNQQNQHNQQDRTPTGSSGPGFGIAGALIAVLGSTFLLQRYRQS